MAANQPPVEQQIQAVVPQGEHAAFVWLRLGACVAILVMNIIILLINPTSGYSSFSRSTLNFLTAASAAVLFMSTTNALFKWNSKTGASVTIVGSFVLVIVGFELLVHAGRPDLQMTAYEVVDENNQAITIEAKDQIDMGRNRVGLQPTYCVDGNKMLLVFPEQLTEVGVGIEHPPGSHHWHRGKITYVGTQAYTLKLGSDLK